MTKTDAKWKLATVMAPFIHSIYWIPDHGETFPIVLGGLQKHNGRWKWWRWPSPHYPEWNGVAQGEAETKSEAIEQVEEGWL